jgi:hypothetical protein
MSRHFDAVMEIAGDLYRAGASPAMIDDYVRVALKNRGARDERREELNEVISEVPDGEGGWRVTTRADEESAHEEALWAAPLG